VLTGRERPKEYIRQTRSQHHVALAVFALERFGIALKITRHVIRLVVALVVVLVVPVSLLVAEDAADLGMGSTLIGKITTETKDLVAGATVIAYRLSTGNFVRSDPTRDTGRFEMAGLDPGYYDLWIETTEGLFVVTRVVNLTPNGKIAVNLRLLTTVPSGQGPWDFPGSDMSASGIAQLIEKSKKKIVGWAVAGSVGGALLLGGGSSSNPSVNKASPSNPN